MEVKEILNKAKKSLNNNDQIFQIIETSHYYICLVEDSKITKEVEGVGLIGLVIDKTSGNIKRYNLGSSVFSLPIDDKEILNGDVIYNIDGIEETENSDDEIDEMFNM